MNPPEADDDLEIPCAVCGLSPERVQMNYVYDPITMEVVGYCAAHYVDRLIALYGEDTALAILHSELAVHAPL